MSRRRGSGIAWRRSLAVDVGKLSAAISRLLGKGGGTALPGLLATRLHPTLVAELAHQLSQGCVVVSGTNGKTTTARMLGAILEATGHLPLRNDSGSNLMRGIAASLVREADFQGNLVASEGTIGLFEVDEAALPDGLDSLQPSTVLLLDLFRDQLDRYGEVATVARVWKLAVHALPAATTLVANADDPLVSDVASHAARALYFGIESAEVITDLPDHASDVKACPKCGGRIEYSSVFLGHLGHYSCPACGFQRPEPSVSARDVTLLGVRGSRFRLVDGASSVEVTLPLPGTYNVYNALGAAAAACALGIDLASIASALDTVTAAFGRMERLSVDNRTVYIALTKNPAGLNEVLRTLITSEDRVHLMIMLNDNIADGRDVSWIWDADVEALRERVATVVFGGTRPEDMALRFKYAGIITDDTVVWEVQRDTTRGLMRAVELTPSDGCLFIVPTYTALLDVRSTLARLGYVKNYWEN